MDVSGHVNIGTLKTFGKLPSFLKQLKLECIVYQCISIILNWNLQNVYVVVLLSCQAMPYFSMLPLDHQDLKANCCSGDALLVLCCDIVNIV